MDFVSLSFEWSSPGTIIVLDPALGSPVEYEKLLQSTTYTVVVVIVVVVVAVVVAVVVVDIVVVVAAIWMAVVVRHIIAITFIGHDNTRL